MIQIIRNSGVLFKAIKNMLHWCWEPLFLKMEVSKLTNCTILVDDEEQWGNEITQYLTSKSVK
jgi:hypothetical protein